ncbi:MAG: hypothetical protein MRY79_00660 [Alphaproteobacteria bacterium]|nr:hypothetical protein [Alphaproteobacteria bacterium]
MSLKNPFYTTDGRTLPVFEQEIRTKFNACQRRSIKLKSPVMIITLLQEQNIDGHNKSEFGLIPTEYDPEEFLQRLESKGYSVIGVFDLNRDFNEQWPSALDGKIHTPEDLAKSPVNNLPDYTSKNVTKLHDFRRR